MKKILVSFLLVALVSSAVFAAPLIQLGPSVQFSKTLKDISAEDFDAEELTKIENYTFGVDARVNVLFLQVALNGMYGKVGDMHNLSSVLSANLLISPIDVINLSVGVGPSINFTTEDFNTFYVNGSKIDEFGDVFMKSPLNYRAQVGINMGSLGLSLTYIIPTVGSFSEINDDTFKPNWDGGKFQASLLFNIL